MRWLDAVTEILQKSKTPLRAVDIAAIAIGEGLVEADRTDFPEDSVRSAVSRHIKDTGNQIGFVITKVAGKSGSLYSIGNNQGKSQ